MLNQIHCTLQLQEVHVQIIFYYGFNEDTLQIQEKSGSQKVNVKMFSAEVPKVLPLPNLFVIFQYCYSNLFKVTLAISAGHKGTLLFIGLCIGEELINSRIGERVCCFLWNASLLTLSGLLQQRRDGYSICTKDQDG